MMEKVILTGHEPTIEITQVHGNLDVRGWEKADTGLEFSPETLDVQESEGRLRLACRGSLEACLPLRTALQVNTVHGQARIKMLEKPITLGQVYGSLALRQVGGAVIDKLHGELTARNLAGRLRVGRILGNVQARGVQGDCVLEEVDGNLDLRSLGGNLKAVVEGNARLSLDTLAGDLYEIEAEGNLYIRLPEEISLRMYLTSGSEVIKLKLPGNARVVPQETLELTLGEGRATLRASAGGNIFIVSQSSDWEAADRETDLEFDVDRLSDDISRQIGVQMEAMARQLNEQMARLTSDLSSSGLTATEVERVVEQARRSSERAQERAQEKMRRAQERMQQKMERIERRNQAWSRHTVPPIPPIPPVPPVPPTPTASRRGWGFEWTPASRATQPADDQVSEEERLMILRMLEQKKISLEEAEQLLAALDAREG